MAPLFSVLVQLLPSLPCTQRSSYQTEPIIHGANLNEVDRQQQRPIALAYGSHGKPYDEGFAETTISTISWGKNRLDWGPSNDELEILGNGLEGPPVAVTWGAGRMDVFGLDDHDVIKHQYWDGTAWRPNIAEFENLGGACDPGYSIAASTWGEGRLDVFCTGPDGSLLHQYFDGSQWQPETGSLESLGGTLASAPSVVSWGKERLDIFGVDPDGEVVHLYWDGSRWSEWEKLLLQVGPALESHALTVTSWGENRLDVYGVGQDSMLFHSYWDGFTWNGWESLGGVSQLAGVAATSQSPNHHEIVVKGGDNDNYWYKYYDGQAWRPDILGWYNKGEDSKFFSNPSVVSWGENRSDIFGINMDSELLHQAWVGSEWFPGSTIWETLGKDVILTNGEGGDIDSSRPVSPELRK